MENRTRIPCRRSLATVLVLLSVAWTAVLLAAPPAAAATLTVSGHITADTVWSNANTYVMVANVTVDPGVALTIQAGTVVQGNPGVRLYVEGALQADGGSGLPILFQNASSSNAVWRGIQFNSTGTGSVTYSAISRAETAIAALRSSPIINNVTVTQCLVGIRLDHSSTDLEDNSLSTLGVGMLLTSSNSSIARNTIDIVNTAIQAVGPGIVVIANNTITNVTGSLAFGISATNLDSVTVTDNTIRSLLGISGVTPVTPGREGTPGGSVVGVFVNASTSVAVTSNWIGQGRGGRGGDGQGNAAGPGGRGGLGGSAAGVIVVKAADVLIQGNNLTGLAGGHGGDGGGSLTTTSGSGGDGGGAAGINLLAVSSSTQLISNELSAYTGGSAGNASITAPIGSFLGKGGIGGDAYGVLSSAALDLSASGLMISALQGGHGGNSSLAAQGTTGGIGGQALGVFVLGADGSTMVHASQISSLTGGVGGTGRVGPGQGGNSSGIVLLGDGSPFNATIVSFGQISGIVGGSGGMGWSVGGNGGPAVGVGLYHVVPSLSSNTFANLQGGDGSTPANGGTAGSGGSAGAVLAGQVIGGTSVGDTVQSVARGADGVGTPGPSTYGVGFFVTGAASAISDFTVTNGTLTSVGDFDLYIDNYTEAATLNTPFSASKLSVQALGNLTVQNYLGVAVLWPNNSTYAAGASLVVDDDGSIVFSGVLPTGQRNWIVVTNREYVNSLTPTYHGTGASVAYGAYTFGNNPRFADMNASHVESFAMIDVDLPFSEASPLPAFEPSWTFSIPYTYSDGNGTGVKNITLWCRIDGGIWSACASQAVSGAPQFTFTASADGVYEFATIAADNSGNVQQPSPPIANNTWTIVDTTRPGSAVDALPAYVTTLTFPVSWAPEPGVTDIDFYSIQYDDGGGWVTWIGDTRSTSGLFTASGQGLYQFRSIARDLAGNAEIAPATNDTWTIVDTIPPSSLASALPLYEASTSFVVDWGPLGGTTDIASYQIQYTDDDGPWTDWLAATSRSATFTGLDGHRYAFRSIATDRAGNTESKTFGNDTWTTVDITPPSSAVGALPRYQTSLSWSISWSPSAGTSDIAAYTVQVSDNGGPWTPLIGSVDTTSTSATFAGTGGHAYAFRSLAEDLAGNAESKVSGNDTWTAVDVTRPFVVSQAPEGAGTNASPLIVIQFSEPMDPQFTQLAFSVTPAMNGNFVWSPDGRSLTFTPARPLQPGTTYVVVVDTGATDRAGNNLAAPKTFTFTTSSSFLLGDLWPILLAAIAAAGGLVLFLLHRRRTAGAGAQAVKAGPPSAAVPSNPAAIDDVFLLYGRDGVLIKHETRRLRPDIDTDILSGMLTAVQQFVKDSFRGEEGEELNEMTVGQMHILIGRGKWLIVAATMSGGDVDSMNHQMKDCIQDMEDHNWDRLEDWDGDMEIAKALSPYLKKLVRGDYGVSSTRLTPAAS